jgi:hypothetical protein
MMGEMYYEGLGVKQSDIEAFRWFEKAAQRGDAIALLNMGSLYYEGQGVKQSDTEAFRWWREGSATRELSGSVYDE